MSSKFEIQQLTKMAPGSSGVWLTHGGTGLVDYKMPSGGYEKVEDAGEAMIEIFEWLCNYYPEKNAFGVSRILESEYRIRDINTDEIVWGPEK